MESFVQLNWAGDLDLANLEVAKRNQASKKEPPDKDYTESAELCHHYDDERIKNDLQLSFYVFDAHHQCAASPTKSSLRLIRDIARGENFSPAHDEASLSGASIRALHLLRGDE
jgi:hypothetical protein